MLRVVIAAVLTALVPVAVQASPRLEQVHPALAAANATERAILFTGDDRQAIDAFFRKHAGQFEPKLIAHREPLLVRDRLPGNVRIRPLPRTLDRQLPTLPPGYDRMIVGRDVVLLELRSYTVVDIIREVIR